MRNEIDWIVDDLLSRWHSWRNGYTYAQGYRGTDSTCRDAQSQWSFHDRSNGTYDDHIESQIMRGVDQAVDRIQDYDGGGTYRGWHLMILIEARNLWSGNVVWNSARLPQNHEEREVLRIEARNRLLLELRRDGIIG